MSVAQRSALGMTRDGSRARATPTDIASTTCGSRGARGGVMRWLFLCALLAGCPDRTIAGLPSVPTGQVEKDIPVSADLDVLFVIDNSSSTQDKQTLFTTNFQHLTDPLRDASGNLPNIHLGVVSTTVDIGVPGFGPCSGAPLEDGRLQH